MRIVDDDGRECLVLPANKVAELRTLLELMLEFLGPREETKRVRRPHKKSSELTPKREIVLKTVAGLPGPATYMEVAGAIGADTTPMNASSVLSYLAGKTRESRIAYVEEVPGRPIRYQLNERGRQYLGINNA